jgi:hypothetical protein
MGRQPAIYTSRRWWHSFTNDAPGFEHYPLWVSDINHASPVLPVPWTKWRGTGSSCQDSWTRTGMPGSARPARACVTCHCSSTAGPSWAFSASVPARRHLWRDAVGSRAGTQRGSHLLMQLKRGACGTSTSLPAPAAGWGWTRSDCVCFEPPTCTINVRPVLLPGSLAIGCAVLQTWRRILLVR